MYFVTPKDGLFFSFFCFFVFIVFYLIVFCFGFDPVYLLFGVAMLVFFEFAIPSRYENSESGDGLLKFIGLFVSCFYFFFLSSLPFPISVFFFNPTAGFYLNYFDSDVESLFFKYLVYHSIIFLFVVLLASVCAKATKKASRYCISKVRVTVRNAIAFIGVSIFSFLAIGFILSSNQSEFFYDEFWMPNYLRLIVLSARLTVFNGLLFLGVVPIFVLFFVLISKVRGIFNVK